MVNSIITGIARKIATLGTKYKVYTSAVKQDLKNPCFIIHIVSTPSSDGISKRKHLSPLISITYIPEIDDEDELRDMISKTVSLFDVIETDSGKVRGRNFEANISDGCLVITGEYKYQVEVKGDNDNKMNSLVREGTVK